MTLKQDYADNLTKYNALRAQNNFLIRKTITLLFLLAFELRRSEKLLNKLDEVSANVFKMDSDKKYKPSVFDLEGSHKHLEDQYQKIEVEYHSLLSLSKKYDDAYLTNPPWYHDIYTLVRIGAFILFMLLVWFSYYATTIQF